MRAGSSIFLIFVIFYVFAQHSTIHLINQKWSVAWGLPSEGLRTENVELWHLLDFDICGF